jgi:hypothetical protein
MKRRFHLQAGIFPLASLRNPDSCRHLERVEELSNWREEKN